MKWLLTYCWEKVKKPFVQTICILVIVAGYWTYDIMFSEHQHLPTNQTVEQMIDTTNVEEMIQSKEFYQRFILPDTTDTQPQPQSIELDKPVEDMSDREFWFVVVDTVLGHLSSIVASAAPFLVPFFTWLSNKRKNNNNNNEVEDGRVN